MVPFLVELILLDMEGGEYKKPILPDNLADISSFRCGGNGGSGSSGGSSDSSGGRS